MFEIIINVHNLGLINTYNYLTKLPAKKHGILHTAHPFKCIFDDFNLLGEL